MIYYPLGPCTPPALGRERKGRPRPSFPRGSVHPAQGPRETADPPPGARAQSPAPAALHDPRLRKLTEEARDGPGERRAEGRADDRSSSRFWPTRDSPPCARSPALQEETDAGGADGQQVAPGAADKDNAAAAPPRGSRAVGTCAHRALYQAAGEPGSPAWSPPTNNDPKKLDFLPSLGPRLVVYRCDSA